MSKIGKINISIPDKIKVAINQRFNLAQTADAFRALTARKTTGVTLIETGL